MNLVKKCINLSNKAYNKKHTIECGNEAFLIEREGKHIFIAIAGSDDWKDWQEDADVKTKMIDQLGMKIHHGFWSSMWQCWRVLKPLLDNMFRRGDIVIITGHSKGGAMAQTLRLKLIMSGYPISAVEVYAFGSPKILDEESGKRYMDHYNQGVHLFENEGDPVTMLPRAYMGYVKMYNSIKVAPMPWYTRIYLVRAINHKIKTYLKNFG